MTVARGPAHDRLATILESRRERVRRELASGRGEKLRRRAEARPIGTERPFERALRADGIRIIAEIKRRSPSAGRLAADGFDPVAQARAYAAGGAAAISVVVERDHFGGDPAWVPGIAAAAGRPVLWKDFVVEEHVVHEAAAAGAAAVLLLAAALDDAELGRLHRRAEELGLSALVEVHDEREAERAARISARIVGINARDLRTFAVDLATVERIARLIPESVVRVAESGIRGPDDVRRLVASGIQAFLVGEALMRSGDPAETIRRLRYESGESAAL